MLLRFGDCELDTTAREIRLAGEPRSLEPRAYDLLAFLAERRNRVVTKQELLAAVWAGQRVADASIARAVMKARQAIGDTGEPPLIRTIPRVGYRLSVQSQESANLPPPTDAASAEPLRIALLPFENATGDESLDWLEYGLMSLVVHTISQDARLSPVAMQSLLAAVDGAAATGLDMAEAVRHATGAQVVVRSRLSQGGKGYELAFEILGAATASKAAIGTVNVVDLASTMASTLEETLFPGNAADALQLQLNDPLAMAAFARGLQALARQKFPQAVNLLRMALELAPGNPLIQMDLLRATCAVGDLNAAKPLARRLFARAERDSSVLSAARVHVALSLAHAIQSAVAPAGYHLEIALRLMADEATLDERGYAHLLQAQLAAFRQDVDGIELALERMRVFCEQSGNKVLLLSRSNMLASVARARVDYERAAELSMQAAQGAHDLHVPRLMVTAELNCAADLVMLGRWPEAAAHAEEAIAAALLQNNPMLIATIGPNACWIYRLTGTPAASQRVIDAMPPDESLPTLSRLWALFARGHHAATSGDHAQAAQLFAQSLQLLREGGNQINEKDTLPWLLISLVLCGRLNDAEAEVAKVSQALLATDKEYSHWLLHGRALLAHARGLNEQALAHLLQLAEAPTAPLWRAWGVLDAAWLQAEAGLGAEALALLRQLPPAFASQGLAHAVAARAHWACGDAASAKQLHQRYLESARHRTPQPYLAQLGKAYAGDASPAAAPHLPSQL